MTIIVMCKSLGKGRYAVATFEQGKFKSVDPLFIGSWDQALKVRNNRTDRWSNIADQVLCGLMPQEVN